MNNNTIVMSSDNNYVWGCWLLIASMRMNSMDEPVIVLADNYTAESVLCLEQFDNVKIVQRDESFKRNLTFSKPDAMLLADTRYVTWVDCDALFYGNCSEYLAPEPGYIHVRQRAYAENAMGYAKFYTEDDKKGPIPDRVLETWQKDVGENEEAAFDTCVSACYISIPMEYRFILKRWREQIAKVMPEDNVGIVDKRSVAYFQTDESVLNSVLCFCKDAPKIVPEFKLDKDPEAFFIHFNYQPKPWHLWNDYTIKHYDKTVSTVEWAVANKYKTPGVIPASLNRKYSFWSHLIAPFTRNYYRARKFMKK